MVHIPSAMGFILFLIASIAEMGRIPFDFRNLNRNLLQASSQNTVEEIRNVFPFGVCTLVFSLCNSCYIVPGRMVFTVPDFYPGALIPLVSLEYFG